VDPQHPRNARLHGLDEATGEVLFSKPLPFPLSADSHWPHWIDPSPSPPSPAAVNSSPEERRRRADGQAGARREEEKMSVEREVEEGSPPAVQCAPPGVEDFLDRARGRLKETFGFDSFREGQERAIRAIAGGRDVLVIMPTGSGKSICYQLPALVLPGVTVVVSPLIALMKDQADGLAVRGVAVTSINSSLSAEEQWERLAKLREGAFRIVYVAPERFRSGGFRSALARIKVSLLAIDEAHCISRWGHDFRPDYRRLREVRALLGPVPAVALTATATPEVQEDIARELELREPERIVTGFDRPSLHLRVKKVQGGEAGKLQALREFVLLVLERHPGGVPAGIVYAGTRKRAEEAAAFLDRDPWPEIASGKRPLARAYHAGLAPEERRQVQEDFMEGRLPWVAATNAFGMGVDKADIRFVAHYDLPGNLEAYYQEVGRGGRDGGRADCLLLFAEGDRRLQEFFIDGANPDRETIEAVYRFLLGLGENPLFKTLEEMETLFQRSAPRGSTNPLAFRSAVATIERSGGLERLDHRENLAEVSLCKALPWPAGAYPERAAVKRGLHEALGRVFERTAGEPASLSLERWAEEMGIGEDSLRRGLRQLDQEGWIRFVPPFRGRAILLPERPRRLEEIGVDFEALARKRERDLQRLIEIIGFARSRSCRRDSILRHFGEPVPPGGCGRCDGCESEPPRALDDQEVLLVRMALSGVARAAGRCGKRKVIQMLRGSSSEGVRSLGLDRLSTYGLLRDHAESEIELLFDLLGSAGCFRESSGKFPVVQLTAMGVKVMRGEELISLALPGRRARRAPASSAGASTDPTGKPRTRAAAVGEVEIDYDPALFERLRRLRREMAEELGVPAYRIFNDRTLRVMARDRPTDEAALLLVPGVGSVTLERFGARFLGVLRSEGSAERG
jgi:ATP-dependent DNA helicase RecQ